MKNRDLDYLEFRCEAYNLINHTNFHVPQTAVNARNAATITRAQPGRVVQFGLKYVF